MRHRKRKVSVQPVPAARPRSHRSIFWPVSAVALVLTLAGLVIQPGRTPSTREAAEGQSSWALEDIPFNGVRAYEYLEKVCDLGRRPSGSEGMAAQQELLDEHFGSLGGVIHRQSFAYPHPQDGKAVAMTNLIVQWMPERSERILLACHYDTLPYPMQDRRDPHGEFVGANDGGSGVALLMELGHEMPELLEKHQTHFGVDFVFFDGEEFLFTPRGGRYFVGSEFFAQQYAAGNLPYQGHYSWGILLDMIGDKDLQIPQEGNGLLWPDTRPLVTEVYGTAKRLGVSEFQHRRGREIQDDHLMLHKWGRIPAIDLIDFEYPPWHTTDDTPNQCSALSLAKVGWVVREWLKTTRPGR